MGRIITNEEIEQAKQLRAQGWTYQRIADKLCYSTSTIYYLFRGERKREKGYEEIPLKWFYEYFQEDKTRTISKLTTEIFGKWEKGRHYAITRLIMGQDVRLPISTLVKLEQLTGKNLTELLERR